MKKQIECEVDLFGTEEISKRAIPRTEKIYFCKAAKKHPQELSPNERSAKIEKTLKVS